ADVQSTGSGVSTEAAFNESIGSQGMSVERGGAAGVADNMVGNPTDSDAFGAATGATGIDDAAGSASVSGGVQAGLESSGYRDPTTEAGRADVLGTHAEGDA